MTRAEEVEYKLGAVRAWLGSRDLGAVLISSQANFAWITAGARSHVSIGDARGVASVLVGFDAAYLITANIELRRILEEEVVGLPFEVLEYPWHHAEGEREVIDDLCDVDRTVSDLGAPDMRVAGPDFAELRYVLLPSELDRYRALGRDAAECVEEACSALKPGDTELAVAGRVARMCEERDILPLVDLVAADGRIARYRHPIPTDARVERTALVALTGRRHGLHASLTRMVSFGPPDAELAERHEAVTNVDARVISASVPGATLNGIFAELVDQYAKGGWPGEWKLHHQGGLTGYGGREIFATPSTTYRLRADQALAWNPSITLVKSEDTILIDGSGFEVVTRTDRWPQREVDLDGKTLERPALLVR